MLVMFLIFSQEKEIISQEKQNEVTALIKASDSVAQYLTMKGATAFEGKFNAKKAKVKTLAEHVRPNAMPDIILSRLEQHFYFKCVTFYPKLLSKLTKCFGLGKEI